MYNSVYIKACTSIKLKIKPSEMNTRTVFRLFIRLVREGNPKAKFCNIHKTVGKKLMPIFLKRQGLPVITLHKTALQD